MIKFIIKNIKLKYYLKCILNNIFKNKLYLYQLNINNYFF